MYVKEGHEIKEEQNRLEGNKVRVKKVGRHVLFQCTIYQRRESDAEKQRRKRLAG